MEEQVQEVIEFNQLESDINSIVQPSTMNESEPWVLIGGPVTSHKLDVIGDYLVGIRELTYKNKVVVLTDNSSDDSLTEACKHFKADFPLYIVKTPRRTYVRERLVEGRNLLSDIVTKKTDRLDSYELSSEDRTAVETFQSDYDFEYFFSLEQDVIPPVDAIERLIADDKDIVSGIYFNSKRFPNGVEGIIPMIWDWANPKAKELELLRDMPMEKLQPSRVFAVAATGVGFVLIKRKVLEDMVSWRYEKDKYACDDMFFSIDTARLGYEIYVDSYLWATHLHKQWDLTQTGER
jgi:hypothetical protein